MNGDASDWPTPDERAVAAIMTTVIAEQGLGIDSVVARVSAARHDAEDDPIARRQVERALSALVDRSDLVLLAPDRVVAPVAALAGRVLTHRVTEDELDGGHISLACDLAPFAYCDDLTTGTGAAVELVGLGDGLPAWIGDDGWLSSWGVGDLLGVELIDGQLAMTTITADAPIDPDLVAGVRGAYERERADPHLPALVDDIFFSVLLDQPAAFTTAGPPLGDLLAAAGLDHRGPLVAHESTVWLHQARADRRRRVGDVTGDDDGLVEAVVRVLDVADLASGAIAVDVALGPLDDTLVRGALDDLVDHDVLAIVSGELLRTSDLVDQRSVTRGFVAALVDAADSNRQRATARYLAALVAQLDGDARAAQDHLAAAHLADASHAPATDLFAYYASVAGDRAVAVQRWSECPRSPVIATELDLLASLPDSPTLPERRVWVGRKARGFVERSEPAREDLAEIAFARTVDPSQEALLRSALDDPLVFDAALHEGGWFDRFLATMGPLLPDDERVLLSRWATRDRDVFEVLDVGAGGALRIAPTDAPERSITTAAPAGRSHGAGPLAVHALVCARVVPDGDAEHLVSGWFVVPPDLLDDVREILAERDPIAVALIAAELDARDRTTSGAIDLRDQLRVTDR